jgi:hypothetical protein
VITISILTRQDAQGDVEYPLTMGANQYPGIVHEWAT